MMEQSKRNSPPGRKIKDVAIELGLDPERDSAYGLYIAKDSY
jgi:hypothetical protein